jgi:hypothetical protein
MRSDRKEQPMRFIPGFHYPLFRDKVIGNELIHLVHLCVTGAAFETKKNHQGDLIVLLSPAGLLTAQGLREDCSLWNIELRPSAAVETMNDVENYLWDSESSTASPAEYS